jgi:hypothetical protein
MAPNLRAVPWRRTIILAVNLASAALTLFTGLRENPVVVFVSGRYDFVRSRLIEGRINYDLVRDDLLDKSKLLNLTQAGEDFRFFSPPVRRPENLGEDRSTCMRVNSMNASVMNMNYDDFWGKGPRRAQIYLYSISAPKCEIVNLMPEWVDDCVTRHGSKEACYRYMLDHFDTLVDDRTAQVGVEVDFGIPGMPFMRCLGRPNRHFPYITDLIVLQSYWAGGDYHLEVQSSDCMAVPLLINSDKKFGLFQTQPVDQRGVVVFAVDNSGWLATIVTTAYGIISLVLVAHGVLNTIFQLRSVYYVPNKLRFVGSFRRYLRYVAPFMPLSALTAEDETTVIRFKGRVIMASDVWINHWLYIVLSIADALVSLRMTYIVLEMGTWMLTKQVNIENFIFMASALTRITWLMCFLHSIIRLVLKIVVRSLKALRIMRAEMRHKIEWYVDASALFLSYKAYSLMLCILLYLFLALHGGTTFMRGADPFKSGVYGGSLQLAGFWKNEIICDLFVILSLLTLWGGICGSLMLTTRYRYAANNSLLQLIQRRFIFVGWDVFTVMDALGIDPFNPELVDDDVAATNCPLGCVIQQMYQSGPSGLLVLTGDYIFHDGGFAKGPIEFCFQPKKAIQMGLLQSANHSRLVSANPSSPSAKMRYTVAPSRVRFDAASARTTIRHTDAEDSAVTGTTNNTEPLTPAMTPAKETIASVSLFDRSLRIFAEGTYGRVLIIDEADPGRYKKSEAGFMEYLVRDALTTMGVLDIKHLLGSRKRLTIR